MLDRRTFLTSTFGAVAALAVGLPAARALAEPLAGLAPGGLPASLGQGLHFVDGWILTDADIRALGSDAV